MGREPVTRRLLGTLAKIPEVLPPMKKYENMPKKTFIFS